MIVRDPYWEERKDADQPVPQSLWVDFDRPTRVPFGFGIHPKPVKPKKRKKAKR